jgi:lipopolysaccharide transport system ATP-binding protein
VNNYFKADDANLELSREFPALSEEFGNEMVRLNSVAITVSSNENFITINDSLSICINFELFKCFESFNLAINFKSLTDDVVVFSQITPVNSIENGQYNSILEIPSNFLNSKYYTLDLHFVTANLSLLTVTNIINFEIIDLRENLNYYGIWSGYVRPQFNFEIKK